ncbi:MAG: hypothetical protein AAFP78_08680 [Pseudomonadota bacterium]
MSEDGPDNAKGAPFDPKAFAASAREADLSRLIGPTALRMLEPDALAAAQEANMAALLAAQRAASAAYQTAFEKQVSELIAALEAAGSRIAEGEDAAVRIAAAYERAIAGFHQLAEDAARANADAFERVREQVRDEAETLSAKRGA